MVDVIIGGDVCPIRRNQPFFKKGDAKGIFNDLLVEFEKADLSVVTLECPLINKNTPILKCGPVLGVESDCINSLTQAKIDILNLANNHIMDHGPIGLRSTLDICAEAGISTVGAGKNLEEARQILIKKIGKIRIGILAVAEHEFSIATDNSWGANPLDLIDYVRNVRCQRDNFDYLIVLFHGGNENYPFPSPRLKDTCHFMVEMGANAVIVQHTHCPGSYEEYQNAHIVYGQGNLIFDWPNQDKAFHEGFLVKLSIAENLSSAMDIIPYLQSDSRVGAIKMDKEVEHLFRKSLKERSLAIKDKTYIKEQWIQFCKKNAFQCIHGLKGYGRFLSFLDRKGLIEKYLYSNKFRIRRKHFYCCESYREILETIFNDYNL